MAATQGTFRGTLPKPTLQLKTVEYYVDGLGRTLAEARSPNHAPRVVRDETECHGEALLLLPQARVVVGGAPDGRPVPDGFAPDGIAGAEAKGGVSGKTVGLGLAGLGAIGAAVAVAAGGGGESTATPPSSSPSVTTPSSSTSAPGGSTQTFTANLFGPGWHRGDCTRPQDLNAQFTTRSSGRADLSLTFTPRFEHQLSVALTPEAPLAGGYPQGPGPMVGASYQVQASTTYSVRVCVPVGPPVDPGPIAVTLTIAHP
jgi:hypothetical protein